MEICVHKFNDFLLFRFPCPLLGFPFMNCFLLVSLFTGICLIKFLLFPFPCPLLCFSFMNCFLLVSLFTGICLIKEN